jgi:hypothetical protein
MEIRYMVGHGWAERVQDTTALPHRVLLIDSAGDVAVVKHWAGEDQDVIHQISGPELQLLAREHRREMRRRRWARIFG